MSVPPPCAPVPELTPLSLPLHLTAALGLALFPPGHIGHLLVRVRLRVRVRVRLRLRLRAGVKVRVRVRVGVSPRPVATLSAERLEGEG